MEDMLWANGVEKIFCDTHLNFVRSESRYTHMHTHTVLSAGLSGIQCESKHNAP